MANELRIGFIGAGAVNFGGAEGPWDHASRLERLPGLHLVGVADVDVAAAERKLRERAGPMYEGTRVFGSFAEMLERCDLDAVWIGLPPCAHGAADNGRDVELRCAEAGVHLFIEKPLSACPPAEVRKVADALARSDVIVSVGYMFRYSKAVERMAELLAEGGARPTAFLARYACAYSQIRKPAWWDLRRSGGPIVEQATHFADLARCLVGEVDLASLRAVAVPEAAPCAQLADSPVLPDGRKCRLAVEEPCRGPVATTAVWRYRGGAIGSLTHGALLHGKKYECEVEVWADGLRLVLQEPYGACRLSIRLPGSEETTVEAFAADDPYLAEDAAFVEAVRGADPSRIRSPYADAVKTHELTWAIRAESSRSQGGFGAGYCPYS